MLKKTIAALIAVVLILLLFAWIRSERADSLASDALNSVKSAETFQDADASTFGMADLKARERVEHFSAYLRQVHLRDTSSCLSQYLHDVEMNRMIFVSGASEDIRPAQPLPDGYYADRAQTCLKAGGKS